MKQGGRVLINLKSGEGELVNGQKAVMGLMDWVGTLIEEDQSIAPITLTLDESDPPKHESKLVRITGVDHP